MSLFCRNRIDTYVVVAVLADIVEILFRVLLAMVLVSQGLEEGARTHIVFATGANALSQSVSKGSSTTISLQTTRYHLLCVNRTLQLGHILRLANGAQEDGLELVHARIREEQCGVIVRDDRRRGDCAQEAKIVSALEMKVS